MAENLEVTMHLSSIMKKTPYEGPASAVTSKNKVGEFDILPRHANFISLIYDRLTIHAPNGKIDYEFKRGVLEVKKNKVHIFLGL